MQGSVCRLPAVALIGMQAGVQCYGPTVSCRYQCVWHCHSDLISPTSNEVMVLHG